MTILERVREIVALEAGVSMGMVTAETKFVDLGMDSLEVVHLIMELEEEFNIGMKDELQILTIADAVSYIQKAVVL